MKAHHRVAPGEEARLTPQGPTAAMVVSQGFLPLRVRAEARGVHHRPAFPGSTLVLGDRDFEVVEETETEEGVVYRLEPWPADQIVRDRVAYGIRLVRAAHEERRRLAERERARRWAFLLSPLVGWLPEQRQIRQCDRFGLDPALATLSSGLLEIVVIFAAYRLTYEQIGVATLGMVPFFAPFLVSAGLRSLFAVLFNEAAGSLPFWLGERLGRVFQRQRERLDATILPLTREAFWARLSLPDRQQRQDDGSWLVTGTLPHLSWQQDKRVMADAVRWMVTSLPPKKQRGRLVYSYVLVPSAEGDGERSEPAPPGPTHYQDEVLAGVDREWTNLLDSFSWLVSMLPAVVQQRALARRGGASVVKRASAISAALSLVAAVWFVLGVGPLNLLTALLLGWDGAARLRCVGQGRYAESLFGPLIADYLRPERLAYRAHRDAERAALRRLDEGAF